jgi:hypothetical protein
MASFIEIRVVSTFWPLKFWIFIKRANKFLITNIDLITYKDLNTITVMNVEKQSIPSVLGSGTSETKETSNLLNWPEWLSFIINPE